MGDAKKGADEQPLSLQGGGEGANVIDLRADRDRTSDLWRAELRIGGSSPVR